MQQENDNLATLGFYKCRAWRCEGKRDYFITEEDIEYSKSLGYTIKLIGLAKRDGEN